MMKFNLTIRNGIYCILIISMLVSLPLLGQKILASAYHFKSSFYVDKWQNEPINQEQYSNAYLAAEFAANIEPANPHYLLTFAKVMEWGVFEGYSVANNELFNHLYMRAIDNRPTWPNAYADYAYNLAFIQHDFPKAWQYSEQSFEYGPYITENIEQALAIGLAYWPNLSATQKSRIFDLSLLAVNSNWRLRKKLEYLSTKYNRQNTLCSFFRYQQKPLSEENIDWLNRALCSENLIKEVH